MADPIEAAARAMREDWVSAGELESETLLWADIEEDERSRWLKQAEAALAAADAARLKDASWMVEDLKLHAFDDCGGKDVPTHLCNQAAALITAQAARIEALEGSLKELLEASEADCGTPGICDEDDETVGASRSEDGTIEPMAMTFGMLRRARSTLEGKS